jgi:hypothetical protein
MSSLYDEAIADAKELVRMAEENATNKLIEAVAPRIRKIVEKRLVEEVSVKEDDDIDSIVASLDDESGDDVPDAGEMGDAGDADADDAEGEFEYEDSDYEEDEDDEDEDFDMDSFSSSGDMASFPLKGVKKINIEFEGEKMLTDEGVELTNESINTLLGIIDGKGGLKDRIREARMELKLLGRALGALNEGRTGRTAALRIVENFNNILRKSLGYQGEINSLPKGKLRESSSRELSLLLKEIKHMSTRSLLRTLLEREERRARLHEADDEAADMGGDEGGDDAADEGGDDAGGDVDVDAVKSALESLASAVGMEVKSADDAGEDAGDEGGDEELDLEGSVYELEEMDELEELENEAHAEEGDMGKMHMESRRRRAARGNTVYSIDESMLRRELRRLRRLREEVEPTGSFGGDPEEEFGHYSDIELNANVKESDAPKAKKEARKVAEAEKKAEKAEERADEAEDKADEAEDKAMKEARKNRALVGRLKEAAAAINGLRRELNEQKLFNAKLLYVNKLMQNTSLPQTKLKAVVEALDSAKTLREANLLYKSLNESLSRTTSSLSEGANRTVGSSSRSTRPGGMINESVGETDRWAVLAGIGEKA